MTDDVTLSRYLAQVLIDEYGSDRITGCDGTVRIYRSGCDMYKTYKTPHGATKYPTVGLLVIIDVFGDDVIVHLFDVTELSERVIKKYTLSDPESIQKILKVTREHVG